jgi:hypothetical protein
MKFPDVEVAGVGLVRFDPVGEWYEFSVPSAAGEVPISFTPGDAGDLGHGPQQAAAIAAGLAELIREAREAICREMLELKNEVWLRAGESPLSAERFMERLTLESVGIRADGSAQFFHHDGGLFWDHCVIIDREADGRFHGAHLFG